MYFRIEEPFDDFISKDKVGWFIKTMHDGDITGIAKHEKDAFDFEFSEDEAKKFITKQSKLGIKLESSKNKSDKKREEDAKKKSKKGKSKKK